MSKLADYGTVIMTAMAREPQRIQSAADVALRTGVAPPTVSKILKRLAREGLIVSVRGAKGGYVLPRSPAQISVAEIILAMEGSLGMTECSSIPGLCARESSCTVRGNWQRINQIVLHVLREMTLDQMTRPVPQTVNISAIKSGRYPGAGVNANAVATNRRSLR
ncbi:MAG TPA: SUF system Fe-S cluster assembly regulator [Casimicrobiaceae bacterium]